MRKVNARKFKIDVQCHCSKFEATVQLHDAIYRLRFYSNSLIHILSLSNLHNSIASLQNNRDNKSHRVTVAQVKCQNEFLGPGGHFNFICMGVCGHRIGKLTHPQTKAGLKTDQFSDYLQ